MDEAQIAVAVANALAAHEAQMSLMDKLAADVQTIAVLGLSIVSSIIGIAKWVNTKTAEVNNGFHRVELRVQALETYKENHDREDREAHGRLERGDIEVLRELREFRTESGEQHRDLAGELKESARKGEDGRARLHARLEETNRDVSALNGDVKTLLGYHDAMKQIGQQSPGA